ncbi:CoA transferase (plasmid) [Skermanella rosea]|uniref:CaiB/BaiF CoA transferase family protein n=1 Tax=Skermanella rosea TaxID=1817965 RepID=UPI001932C604|nr:CoA transferase [Skermanella rosea]UEM07557.1 CoA transferase [Skermanella rosea]
MSARTGAGPLGGIKVIELGAFIAGPFCGQILADLGADVVKVEPPSGGDAMRQWGAVQRDGKSLWWPVIARNKQSVTLDLRTADGQEIVRKLAREADVLIENFRPGTLEKWNLSPEALQADNERLIVGRVSGFGQTGPYRNRAGFGAIAEAMAGLRNLAGYPDQPPPRVGVSIGDSLAGMFTAIGILAALEARHGSGRGQTVDVGITDSILGVLESVVSEYSATGAIRRRTGSTLPGIAPSNLYPTGDGSWILIAGNGDGIFRRLATAMGRPELGEDPRYATHRERGIRQRELDDLIASWTRTRTMADLLDLMEEHGVPAGPVSDAADVAGNPHFRERGSVVDIETEDYGTLAMQGVVPRLSETPGTIRWVGPPLGAHTDRILADRLGLDEQALAGLRARGVI